MIHQKHRAVYAAKKGWTRFNESYNELMEFLKRSFSEGSTDIQVEATSSSLTLLVIGEPVLISKRLIAKDKSLEFLEVSFHYRSIKDGEVILKLYIDEWEVVYLDVERQNQFCDLARSDLAEVISSELIYCLLDSKALRA